MQEARISRLTAPPVLLRFGCTALALALLGLGFHYATHRGLVWDEGIVAGRDFLAFYTAGRILLEGNGARLYDLALQQQVQSEILAPETVNGFLPFVNPAPVALLYRGLAWLPYPQAFAVHCVVMVLLFGLGVRLLLPALEGLSPHGWTITVMGLSWLPMFVTVFGGQNAALSFALLCLAYAASVARRDWLVGVALGLLLFKPQYAVPFAGLLLVRKRVVTTGVFGLLTVVHYGVGAAICGWDWPKQLFQLTTGPFRAAERLANGGRHISLSEALDYSLVLPFETSEAAAWLEPLVSTLAALHVLAGVVLLIWTWRRAEPARVDFGLYWALVIPLMLLISPHAQFYEIALLLLPVLLVLERRIVERKPVGALERLALIGGYFVLPLYSLADALSFQPLILLPVAVAVWVMRELRAGHEGPLVTRRSQGT